MVGGVVKGIYKPEDLKTDQQGDRYKGQQCSDSRRLSVLSVQACYF